jgi:hypothetical protein
MDMSCSYTLGRGTYERTSAWWYASGAKALHPANWMLRIWWINFVYDFRALSSIPNPAHNGRNNYEKFPQLPSETITPQSSTHNLGTSRGEELSLWNGSGRSIEAILAS